MAPLVLHVQLALVQGAANAIGNRPVGIEFRCECDRHRFASRVNFEMRELLVAGFVRPADVSRQNEVTYDKLASARISYGGVGQISDVQQPRWGQQVADIVLPF